MKLENCDDEIDSKAFHLRQQRENLQKEIFIKGINAWFRYAKSESRIYDLYFDFSDGILLAELLTIVTNNHFSKPVDRVNNRIAHVMNVNNSLIYLSEHHRRFPRFPRLAAEDIVDQKVTPILTLCHNLIVIFGEAPELVESNEVQETDSGQKFNGALHSNTSDARSVGEGIAPILNNNDATMATDGHNNSLTLAILLLAVFLCVYHNCVTFVLPCIRQFFL